MPVAALEPIAPAAPSTHAIPVDALPVGPFAPNLAPPVAQFIGPVATPNQFAAIRTATTSQLLKTLTPARFRRAPTFPCSRRTLTRPIHAARFCGRRDSRSAGPAVSPRPGIGGGFPGPTGGGSFLDGARRFIDIRVPFRSEHLLNKHKSNNLDPFAEDCGAGSKEYVHIRIQQRNDRKCLTTVQGLEKEFSYNKILKDLKKEFCCNGTAVHDTELGQV